jgi:dTDP-4-dehydrorhamnose reductase
MKTLLVTGGNGLLGSKLLSGSRSAYRLVSLDVEPEPRVVREGVAYIECDIRDRDGIGRRVNEVRPDAVIHTAAFTHVDGCEIDAEKANEVNVLGTENVVRACHPLEIPLIHLSTDYVFDGSNGPYTEEDTPHPISVYGRTKYESETIVLEGMRQGVVARTMVLYGYAPQVRQNFVTWLVNSLRQENSVRIVSDQYGTPTWAEDLAGMVLALYENNCRGVFHTAGSTLNSRYDFALEIADIFHLDSGLIQPITTDQLDQMAPRPLRSGLIIDKLRKETGYVPCSLRESLERMRTQILAGEGGTP